MWINKQDNSIVLLFAQNCPYIPLYAPCRLPKMIYRQSNDCRNIQILLKDEETHF